MSYLFTIAVAATILLTVTISHSEIYTWTGEDGSVNFTDDPGNIPRKGRSKVTTVVTEAVYEVPDITGSWTNGQTGFERFGYYFVDNGRGFCTSGYSVPQAKVPATGADFNWSIDRDGVITILPRIGSKKDPIQGIYNAEPEEICMYAKDKKGCSMKLTPIQDETYNAKLRRHAKHVSSDTGRFLFAEVTATDRITGLVWAREGGLSTSDYGIYRDNISDFLRRLNERHYAGRSDWRLPTVAELRSLMDSVAENTANETTPRNQYIYKKLNDLGFIGMKGSYYWTADPSPNKGDKCQRRISFSDRDMNCMDYPSELLPVAGPAGNHMF